MNTLASQTLTSLLNRLFDEADANRPHIPETLRADVERMMRSRTEYRELYRLAKDYALPVSRDAGRLLYMLARGCNAKNIVEFGTSFGISTLHLAAALRDNGGGRLITTEFEPSKVLRASKNLEEADLLDLVEIREGDALETLAMNLPEMIDLVLLDGAKALYPDILQLLESRLRPGAFIVADNIEYSPEYVERV
ncbi:MAG TPA: class I SAM-dependent methyltransferase, partial [Steroidobacteraceae bacterium]|nr:class I SAM-dependent methyltransferase [Steroidobacteraceae bacterium]